MRSFKQLFLCSLVLGAVTAPAHAQSDDGALLVHCQNGVTARATRFERARRAALGQCVRKALKCPAILTGSATAQTDSCLGDVATTCQDRITKLAAGGATLLAALTQCTQATDTGPGLPVDAIVDDLSYGNLTALLCPQATLTPDQLSQCQAHVLACNADLALTTMMPRAAEVLARLGLPLDDSGCIGNTPCGNGDLDRDEECDDGADNSDTEPDACRTDCKDAYCGDGVVDADEDCDDGNPTDGDGCESDCTFTPSATCGDGNLDPGEECDDGADDSDTEPDACRTNCEDAHCGDAVVDSDEECDDGNTIDGDGCESDCTVTAGSFCGDGVVDDNEECDDGSDNSDTAPDACRTDCTDPRCGDGVVDPGDDESCEPPGTLLCTSACQSRLALPIVTPDRAVAPDSTPAADLARCQITILAAAQGLYERTVSLEERCAAKVLHCTFGIPEDSDPDGDKADACFTRVNDLCLKIAEQRDALLAKRIAKTVERCTTGEPAAPISLASLIDATEGLGYQSAAVACPVADDETVDDAALLTCVYRATICTAEGTVARAIPSAADLLGQLDLDAGTVFPCVTDLQGD
jgi:cysteine-rich repeat protein